MSVHMIVTCMSCDLSADVIVFTYPTADYGCGAHPSQCDHLCPSYRQTHNTVTMTTALNLYYYSWHHIIFVQIIDIE